MPNLRPYLLALALSLLFTAVVPAGGPFLDLTIDEALARAKAEEKIVFIDFFAVWCGPCKQLDSTTFADEKVIEWLSKHTIPLKVDVDKQKDLARNYLVKSMPTLLFLRPDGVELQRIRGYQTSDQFLKAAGEVTANPEKDAVTRAREELETGNWPEAMARQKLATALLSTGEQEEALAEYMKALDSLGTDMMSCKYRVRLISDVCAMAEGYPPAGESMRALRERLVKRLDADEADRYDVDQITAIDNGLDQREKTLELYNSLKQKGDVPGELMSGFARSCRDLLLEDRQYAALEAESYGGVLFRALADINSLNRQKAWADGDFSGLPADQAEKLKKRFESMSDEQRARAAADISEHLVGNIGELYQIALGVDKTADAATIAGKLLEAYPEALTYHTLAANALSSGKPTEADLGFAEKAVELDKGEHPEYVETRDQLLEHFGGTEEN